MTDSTTNADAVVVGAGFAGLYMVYRLREQGLRVVGLEAAPGVGGTWYWNRYPGARCDTESMAYSYSFSAELEQDWEWRERYPGQPEILDYLEHVAERFDLTPHFRFDTVVTAAHHEGPAQGWAVVTSRGERLRCRWLIMATGCLSVPLTPDISGLDDFAGATYYTSRWPAQTVDFAGLRVGVIGTGSSGIQVIPVIAEQAARLTVYQRTANFSVPAHNRDLEPQWVREFKARYRTHRDDMRAGRVAGFGDLQLPDHERGTSLPSALALPAPELQALYERYWQLGGTRFLRVCDDTLTDAQANALAADFVRGKIREIVSDPAVVERLMPTTYPIGTKRICVDTDYYATFNRPNVRLVDLSETPITRITTAGVVAGHREQPLDALVLATGFDAMTGALRAIDIRGVNGTLLCEQWRDGPATYLGVAVAEFPNLFLVTGPGSPSVLSNMVVSIEQHVDWIAGCIAFMSERGYAECTVAPSAQADWMAHVNEVADATLYPRAASWYMGANVQGKPRVFMPYAGGVGPFREICDAVAADGYRGFRFS